MIEHDKLSIVYFCSFPVKLIIWQKKACCKYNAWMSADIKILMSANDHALSVKHMIFFQQNRRKLFIRVTGLYLKTFIFDNSSHSPKTAEIQHVVPTTLRPSNSCILNNHQSCRSFSIIILFPNYIQVTRICIPCILFSWLFAITHNILILNSQFGAMHLQFQK